MSTQRAWGVTWIGHAVCEFSKWKVLYLMRPQGETSLSRRQTCFSKVQSVQSVTKFGTNPSALAPLIRADQALPQRSRQKPKSFWVSPGSAEQALPVICCLYISFIRFLLCKGNSLWFRRIDNPPDPSHPESPCHLSISHPFRGFSGCIKSAGNLRKPNQAVHCNTHGVHATKWTRHIRAPSQS